MRRLISLMLWLALAGNALAANFTVATVADLATARPGDGDVVTLCGYTAINDGGGGQLVYDADSTATVDAGVVFAGPGSNGRYLRLWSDYVNIIWYGDCDAGGVDVAPLLRKAMVHGDVYFPPGSYDFDSYVNLKANRKYFGASGYRSILRRTGAQTSIFAIANYDVEAFDEATFVEAKENIEICDLTFDWHFDAGWVNFAGLILIKGSDTAAGDDRLEDISIRRCKFIDSYGVAHGASDAWAINYASAATTQKKLFIEDNRCEAEHHQFCAGGADGWSHVRIRRNYIYHPQANGITMSTLTPDAAWSDVEISDNQIIGPYSLGIWVGPDLIGSTGYQTYRDIKIHDNKIVFDSYSDGGTISGIHVNVYEGLTDDVHVSDNKISYDSTYSNAAASNSITLVNNGERSATVAAAYTQPAVGASVNILLTDSANFAVGTLLNVSGGGTYAITNINTGTPNEMSVTRLSFFNAAVTGATVAISSAATSMGTLSSCFINGNKCGTGRIALTGTTACSVSGNSFTTLALSNGNKSLTVIGNDLQRLSHASHATGVMQANRFVQYDDSGSYGSLHITPGAWNGFTSEDSLLYADNHVSTSGEPVSLTRFAYESGQGVFSGRYYDNIAGDTSARGFTLAHSPATFTADDATDVCTAASHGMYNGQLVRINTDSTIPAGLSQTTNYYVVNRDTNTFKLSATREGAAVDITSTGSGTHYVTPIRKSMDNVMYDANVSSWPASVNNVRYFAATLNFDLTSVNTQTLIVQTPGVEANAIVLISVPSGAATDAAQFSAQMSGPGSIRVTCSRTDQAAAVNPNSGSFQFIIFDPR